MSSTRHAKDPAGFHQSRYASSSEYEPGLNASLVARRCSVLDDPEDRSLIWWLQLLSLPPRGLRTVAEKLVANYGDHFGTEQMARVGKCAGQKYNADEVRKIRQELPVHLRSRFPLRGEIDRELKRESNHFYRVAERAQRAMEIEDGDGFSESNRIAIERAAVLSKEETQDHERAAKYPTAYLVDDFLNLCRDGALTLEEPSVNALAHELRILCLNAACQPHSAAPWYCFNLDRLLRDYMRDWIAQRSDGVVVTALGKQVHEMLDYTLESSSMTLLVGHARRGKSFAGRSWCEQHPGRARFVEVPTGNDDTSFFRAIARGLGMGNFSQYKAIELRERVESVLLTGDILVCLDESQRLWPEVNLRCGFPKRISWVMSMANQGVPFCLIATPQFFDRQNLSDQIAGWNSAQFIGRLRSWKALPEELEIDDLLAVARAVLPEADNRTLRGLALYARTSARYLAAIDAIASRARFNAARAGREQPTAEDVRKAAQEDVMPSDSSLVHTLEKLKKSHARRQTILSERSSFGVLPATEARMSGDVSECDEAPALDRRVGNRAGAPPIDKR